MREELEFLEEYLKRHASSLIQEEHTEEPSNSITVRFINDVTTYEEYLIYGAAGEYTENLPSQIRIPKELFSYSEQQGIQNPMVFLQRKRGTSIRIVGLPPHILKNIVIKIGKEILSAKEIVYGGCIRILSDANVIELIYKR